MTSKYAGGRRLCVGLVAAVGIVGVTVTPAISQQAAEEVMEEIVVEAPITRTQAGRTSIGARVEVIELKRRVSYADLDLGRHADVIELEARIKATAKEACETLDEMFPLDLLDGGEVRQCTRSAIRGTEEQKQAAIAAATAPASGQ